MKNQGQSPVKKSQLISDNSNLHQCETKLWESEELYRLILSNISDMVLMTDDRGEFTYVCPNAEIILGYSAQEVEKFGNVVNLLGDELFEVEELEKSREICNLERQIKDKADRCHTLLINVKRAEIHGGTTLYCCRDITKRKIVEEALQKSDCQFRAVFEGTLDGMMIASDEGKCLDANQAACDLLGLSKENAIANKISDLLQLDGYFAEAWQSFQEQGGGKGEFCLRRTDGNVKEIEYTIVTNFLPHHHLCVMRDITSHKRAESALQKTQAELETRVEERTAQLAESNALLRQELIERKRVEEALRQSEATKHALLNAIPDLMFCLKKDGTFVDFKGAKDFQLLIPPSEFLGKKVSEVMPLEIAQQLEQSIKKAIQTGNTIVFEYQLSRDGNLGEYEARIVVSREDEVLVIVRDITSKKRIEEQLQQANEKLICWVEELEQHNQEMTWLGEMSEFLQACLTVEEAHSGLATRLEPMFPGSFGGVFMVETANNLVEVVTSWGTPLLSETRFQLNECWALQRGRLHWVDQADSDLLCRHIHCHPRPAESLCLPMMAQGEALALLYLGSLKGGRLTVAKQKLAAMVAEHIALALANLKLRDTLKSESIHDPLTNLFNRRYMEESLEREMHRARRQQQPLGVIMIDIDYFKQFNDTFGHEAGDRVLQELASFLQRNIRVSDIACRYGGEELLLILPEASLADTRARAEQLREGVKCLQVEHCCQKLGAITISMGVACFPEQGLTAEEVIRAADAALYQAKREGRDRTVVHSNSQISQFTSTDQAKQ